MSIRYRKVQDNREKSKNRGKWYGRAIIMDEISTKELADEIAHATTVTYADVLAVLAETAVFMRNHLLNSQKVTLDGIGSFRVGMTTRPAESFEKFDSGNISGYHIVYTPVRTFNVTGVNKAGNRTGFYVKPLLQGATAKEAPLIKNAACANPDAQPGHGNDTTTAKPAE